MKKRKKKKKKSKKQEHKKKRWKRSDNRTQVVDKGFDSVLSITAKEKNANSQIKSISQIADYKFPVPETSAKSNRIDNSHSSPSDNMTPSGRRQSYMFVAPRDFNQSKQSRPSD